jgi:hypothetical protein
MLNGFIFRDATRRASGSAEGEVKKSTHGYYKEVAGIFIQRDASERRWFRNYARLHPEQEVFVEQFPDASGSSAQTNRAVPSQLRGLGPEAA